MIGPTMALQFGFLALLTATCFAREDDLDQAWPSPDRRHLLRHTDTFVPRQTAQKRKTDLYDQPAAYILTREGKVLWQMESPVDESAHSFRCVWATDSKSAILLDRPCRGYVDISLVKPGQPARSSPLALPRIIDIVIKKTGDDDDHYLEKAWFGQWRYVKGRFEGIVIVALAHYHRLHLILEPAARHPTLKLLDTVTFKTWDDGMAAL